MILLLFGQPASGKTTLANEFTAHYKSVTDLYKFILIDGDRWRNVTKNSNYTKEGRIENLKQAFNMALYLEKEGYTPVLSFITPYEELRQYLRENAIKLIEIYLTYNEDRGRNNYFASEFEKPSGSYLELDTSLVSISDCVAKIREYMENSKL